MQRSARGVAVVARPNFRRRINQAVPRELAGAPSNSAPTRVSTSWLCRPLTCSPSHATWHTHLMESQYRSLSCRLCHSPAATQFGVNAFGQRILTRDCEWSENRPPITYGPGGVEFLTADFGWARICRKERAEPEVRASAVRSRGRADIRLQPGWRSTNGDACYTWRPPARLRAWQVF